MNYTVEQLEDGNIKYTFKVKMTYNITEFPEKNLIQIFSEVLGFGNQVDFDWPFEITTENELSATELLDFTQKITSDPDF